MRRRQIHCLRAGSKKHILPVAVLLIGLVSAACAEESPLPRPSITLTMEGMSGETHRHDHDENAKEWEGTPPTLELRVDEGPDGLVAVLEADGFAFTDPSNEMHVPGLGHTHVFVDGTLWQMAYRSDVPLGALEPGPHHVEVTLATGDHADYIVDGEILGVATMVTVAGEVEPAALAISIGFAGGLVDIADDRYAVARHGIVEIAITSDVAEEVHVHGYNIRRAIEAGVTTTMRFPADIPGVFEVELEDSRVPLFELTVE